MQTQPAERVQITFLISRCNDVTGPNRLVHIQRGTSGDAKIQTAEKKKTVAAKWQNLTSNKKKREKEMEIKIK